MAAINFHKHFAPMVESGEKKQTIRKIKTEPIKVGDSLKLYQGYKSKGAKVLAEVQCQGITPLQIISDAHINLNGFGMRRSKYAEQFEDIAKADGFSSWSEMFAWFNNKYELPMQFVIIKWDVPTGKE